MAKVHEYAKEKGIETKQLMDFLKGKGFTDVKPLSGMSPEMEVAFESMDVSRETAVAPEEKPKAESDDVVYISRSRRFSVGNYKREVRVGGYIEEPAKSLIFENWGLIIKPDDEEREQKIKFMENHMNKDPGSVRIGSHEELSKIRHARMPRVVDFTPAGRDVKTVEEQSIRTANESVP